ncbi:hypothetical protein METBIDRAFT_144466 [Metschnikowia bicuspidata var. bicuspidata NRRL YB-4993]|uniref:Uncharacterized protein n=1 Tax=Metschnikowia bicuspidata var. bicuspidata NRRL YB-4993 TaxID=869754 RepID=A0A1A0HDE9_9ASCO|nr:hypothetical protein METBIDRAFT_144466 [Metschnikowia bicuspidata var. bicuspidata NRRL YB-4993]OBA22000.1 hypothetical protein METBIDRAFT_144466 [Metschnikowia bicuspidata var. bicuspidata NRRL YB-4993]
MPWNRVFPPWFFRDTSHADNLAGPDSGVPPLFAKVQTWPGRRGRSRMPVDLTSAVFVFARLKPGGSPARLVESQKNRNRSLRRLSAGTAFQVQATQKLGVSLACGFGLRAVWRTRAECGGTVHLPPGVFHAFDVVHGFHVLEHELIVRGQEVGKGLFDPAYSRG